jgi:hypothetical protein
MKKGISLIVLVITIIVIIILAGAVILSLSANNPITSATKATFIGDVSNLKAELVLYEVKQYADNVGSYDIKLLQATGTSVTYNGTVIPGKTIKDVITLLGTSTKYNGQFSIVNGELVYQGSDTNFQNWATETGVPVVVANQPTVSLGTNGGNNLTQVSTTITVTDISGTGLNASTLQYIWDTQRITTPSTGWTVFVNGATVTKAVIGTYYLWIKGTDNSGNTIVTKSNVFNVGDVSTIASTIKTVNTTFSGATTGFTFSEPVIPAGFVAVNTVDANWDNLSTDWDKGLIVQDASGNQFVWVPINGTTVTYAKWCTTGYPYNDASISDDSTPTGFSATNITTTYKGFYIARYESMFDYNAGSIRAASKKSLNKTNLSWTRDNSHTGYLFNFVNYPDSKTYAENMATSYGYDTSKVGTNLITGAEWDTTMKWIQNSGKSVTDSRVWGNHSDSISPANVGNNTLQISGYNNNWKAKNIYDLAGNTWEWNNEIYSSYRISRGGDYDVSGSTFPAACRNLNVASGATYSISFRAVLYVL